MATISAAFNLISGALQADQSALNIVANNVANANTPGYTQQVANSQENTPVQINGVSYGTGVSKTGGTSLRDRVLEERLQQQQQAASASGTRLAALESVQALFPPDSGSSSATAGDIGSDVTGFFASFASLEANPTDNSLREQVLSTARTLAGDISNAAASLTAQRTSLDQEASSVTSQVDSLTSAIAGLNVQIQSTSPHADAGTLEDQRQQDLSKLSLLIGNNQITTENNGISLTTSSGDMLVSEGTAYPLTTGTINGETHFFVGTSDITSSLTNGGGQLGGFLTARDQDIPQVIAALDQLAYGISIQVNALNNAGSDLAGNTGTAANPLNIFRQPAAVAGSAMNMSIVMSDPAQIAAAAAGQGSGDSGNCAALAALATQAIANGLTPSDFYSNFVTALGSTVSGVQIENTAQNASVTQLQTARDSLSSVNLNDEASTMQEFERSYQAASQVFAILNTVMNSALNLGVQTAVS
ncbi:flagellar hook-associated protein FlgK [Telmatobacter sp. DSM 110680]|uniref:Flagellar hook-associated protein 1 n=1 Tax=Telmatobacter sp. DSM 110680 TaxID=3036704 RepID=A0AAU7DFN5_9BACT